MSLFLSLGGQLVISANLRALTSFIVIEHICQRNQSRVRLAKSSAKPGVHSFSLPTLILLCREGGC